MKNSDYISDENLLYKIKLITHENDSECQKILDFLNEMNPKHMYFLNDSKERILFFDRDYKYEVLRINETYHDIIKIYNHVFKTKLLFKSIKTNNYYGNIIIDNELITLPAIINLGLTRYNTIKFINNDIKNKLGDSAFCGQTDIENFEFRYKNRSIIVFGTHDTLEEYIEIENQ